MMAARFTLDSMRPRGMGGAVRNGKDCVGVCAVRLSRRVFRHFTNGVPVFRHVFGIAAGGVSLFTDGLEIGLRSSVQRWLIRFPERRFALNSSGSAEFGTFFRDPLGRYGRVEGTLAARWLPRARGDDYETQVSLRGGRTIGDVPFDELFTLGFDRDTPLWLRGHPGLRDGQKGDAPLGRNFVLVNAETDKIVYRNGIFTVKTGPFVDTGKTYDPSGYFGSPKRLSDTGVLE